MAHQVQLDDTPSDLHADEFYFSALFDDETAPLVPLSDDKYAHELQLQETLMNSLTTTNQNAPSSSSSSSFPPPLLCVASSSNSVQVTTAPAVAKTEPADFA